MDVTRTIVWADADQEQLIREAVTYASLQVVAVGSDSTVAANDLGKAIEAEVLADLRAAGQSGDYDLLWLAGSAPIDPEIRRLLTDTDLLIVSSQPPMSSIADLTDNPAVAARTTFVPRMRRSAGCRAASDVLAQFGIVHCVNVSLRNGPGHGTLFARLFDAMDVVEHFCGPIESINAGFAGPLTDVPESLPGLRGHMTINLRFKQNRCASITLSDCAGQWFRGVTVLGDGGCLRINDNGFDWINPAGQLIDHQGSGEHASPGALVGAQIKRMLEAKDNTEAPPDHVTLLALCEAARLSCLTGQDETPSKLIEVFSRP